MVFFVIVKEVEDAELLEMMDACDQEDGVIPLAAPSDAHPTIPPAAQVIKKF